MFHQLSGLYLWIFKLILTDLLLKNVKAFSMLLLHWKVLNPFSRGCEAKRFCYNLSSKNSFYFHFDKESDLWMTRITSFTVFQCLWCKIKLLANSSVTPEGSLMISQLSISKILFWVWQSIELIFVLFCLTRCWPESTSNRSKSICPCCMSVYRSEITEGGVCCKINFSAGHTIFSHFEFTTL